MSSGDGLCSGMHGTKGKLWYQNLFDNLPFPTMVLDRDMRVVETNRELIQRYGLDADKVVGSTCYQVMHPGQEGPCPRRSCHFHDALAGAEGRVNLHEYRDYQGRQVVEEVILVPLRDEKGQVCGVMESIRDITEAQVLQENLTKSNEFLNRLLDSLVGVVLAADLKGRILFVNKSVRSVLGYEPAELVGRNLGLLSSQQELRRIGRELRRNQGRALMVRTYMLRKDGEKVPGRVNSTYVYSKGEPIATVGIFTDLRQQLKMEHHLEEARIQLVQSEKLASLGRMAAGVAHELNNPLTGITVYADLLRESLPPDDPAQEDLACIMEDAERCRDIVKGLLEYSRQSDMEVRREDLSQIIEDTFSLIRDNAVFLHIQIEKRYHPEPLWVHCDRKLIRQVFINLFVNAVDAMEGHGGLTVTTYRDGEGWRVAEVSDTGPGIDPEHLRSIFDPFFTTKEVGKGTGLGLSVVYGVVQRHGGEIKVKNTGPEGTTFLLRLPPDPPRGLLQGGEARDNGVEDPEEEVIA